MQNLNTLAKFEAAKQAGLSYLETYFLALRLI